MAEIQGLEKLMAKLSARQRQAAEANVTIIVGFTQNYALSVHENLQSHHPVGQAKFLEQPARELAPTFGRVVKELLAKGLTMIKALLIVGLRLQREAQQLTPVDTGALKGSAFTRVEE